MKYKLIKTYPGSPDLGVILENTYGFYSRRDDRPAINSDDVENNPEYWEKVVEKDYEILSLIGKSSGRVMRVLNPKTGLFDLEGSSFSKALEVDILLKSGYNIHSIKRLSDGEIFTIDDKITGKSKYNCTVNSIELNPNCPQIMFNRLDEGIDLINAKKVKQPLFTTEDDVDIFEGDTIFGVNIDWKVFLHYTDLQNKIKSWGIKPIFSTKEAAEEYIIMNKPCLSINDLKPWGDLLMKEVLKLVKSKIKQSV